MKTTFAKPAIKTFKPRKPLRQREEPLTPGQAAGVREMITVYEELLAASQAKVAASVKPKPTSPLTATRQLVQPSLAWTYGSKRPGISA